MVEGIGKLSEESCTFPSPNPTPFLSKTFALIESLLSVFPVGKKPRPNVSVCAGCCLLERRCGVKGMHPEGKREVSRKVALAERHYRKTDISHKALCRKSMPRPVRPPTKDLRWNDGEIRAAMGHQGFGSTTASAKTKGCAIGAGWCFPSWKSKGITPICRSHKASTENRKKSVLSSYCGDETTHPMTEPKKKAVLWKMVDAFFLEVPKD